jgi:hypothetical protein
MLTFDLHLHTCHLYRPSFHAARDARATVLARFLSLEGRRRRAFRPVANGCRAVGSAS